MDIRPDHIKTINRLIAQNKQSTMKDLLRTWILNEDLSIDSLLYNCRNKDIAIPLQVINKIASLFANGKEGVPIDINIAFKFYEVAAYLNSATANYYCAQYLFDGQLIGGKKLELAYSYCLRSIELGSKRYTLMSEIYYEKMNYPAAVGYARRVIDDDYFTNYGNNGNSGGNSGANGANSNSYSTNKQRKIAFLIEKKSLEKQLQYVFATVHNLLIQSSLSTNSIDDDNRVTSMISQLNISKQKALEAPNPNVKGIKYSGWDYISEELDGFDCNCCGKLTSIAKVIELETNATKAALEVAKDHVLIAKKNYVVKEVIALLEMKQKEFESVAKDLETAHKKNANDWLDYTDIEEHTIRRQLKAEQLYFDPHRTIVREVYLLANTLLERRLQEGELFPPFQLLDEDSLRTLPARELLTVERSIIDATTDCFGYQINTSNWNTGNLSFPSFPVLESRSPAGRSNSIDSFIQATCSKEYDFFETMKIGHAAIKYRQRISPQQQKLGEFWIEHLEPMSCDLILQQIDTITQSEHDCPCVQNEMKLAKLIEKFARYGQPIILPDLYDISEDCTEIDVTNMNRIVYSLVVLQLVPWIIAPVHNADGNYSNIYSSSKLSLPLATAFARAIQLIAHGHLSFRELLTYESPLNIIVLTTQYLDRNVMKNLKDNVKRINRLYNNAILHQRPANFSAYIQYWKGHPGGETLPTLREINRELREFFGGEHDTVDDLNFEDDNDYIEQLYHRLSK